MCPCPYPYGSCCSSTDSGNLTGAAAVAKSHESSSWWHVCETLGRAARNTWKGCLKPFWRDLLDGILKQQCKNSKDRFWFLSFSMDWFIVFIRFIRFIRTHSFDSFYLFDSFGLIRLIRLIHLESFIWFIQTHSFGSFDSFRLIRLIRFIYLIQLCNLVDMRSPQWYLGLPGNQLSDTSAHHLTKLVAACTFSSLDLRENQFTEKGVVLLASAATNHANGTPRFARLHLQNNAIADPYGLQRQLHSFRGGLVSRSLTFTRFCIGPQGSQQHSSKDGCQDGF